MEEVGLRVLVTGDRGYVGAVLVPHLRARGHEVVGLDAGWYDGCDFGPQPAGYEQRTGDIRDVAPADLEGFDAVVHLAAVSDDQVGSLDPHATYGVNAYGAVHVAEAAKAAGVPRFLLASSCSLYGSTDEPAVETSPLDPASPYGEGKAMAEAGVSALADEGFSPTYLRSATAYGSSPRLRGDLLLNRLTGAACTRGAVPLTSDGEAWRALVHVEDLARAFAVVLEAPREVVHDHTLNVGRAEDVVQVRTLAGQVSEVTGAPVVPVPGEATDARDQRVDFSKIAELLPAFAPRWTTRQGVEEVFARMQELGVTAKDLEGPTFVRLQRVQQLAAQGQLDLEDLRRPTS